MLYLIRTFSQRARKVKLNRISKYLLCTFLFTGCASHYQIERQHNTFLRRMPQMNRIETGRPLQKGDFSASLNLSYSLKVPQILKVSDNSFDSRSSFFGDEFTITSSSNIYCFESRATASGEGVFAFTDEIALGLSLDASGGRLEGVPIQNTKTLYHDNIEGSLILKFAKQYGHIGVCLKPELTMTHLYGERISKESEYGHQTINFTEEYSNFTFSIRSSSVMRYEIAKFFTPFMGFQIKTQPYPRADDDINHELYYGVYGGFDFSFKNLNVAPFLGYPISSTSSKYTSPMNAGVHMAFTLVNKKSD